MIIIVAFAVFAIITALFMWCIVYVGTLDATMSSEGDDEFVDGEGHRI